MTEFRAMDAARLTALSLFAESSPGEARRPAASAIETSAAVGNAGSGDADLAPPA